MFRLLNPSIPCLMGIVNVTPNSFSDGTLDSAAATARARQLVTDGAAILDFGAEASSFFRPGVQPVSAAEQLSRLLPVLEFVADLPHDIIFSIDTRSAVVAETILTTPSLKKCSRNVLINDISAGTHDPDILPVVARHNAGIVLMHISPGYPATPLVDDPDILSTVANYLLSRAQAAIDAGIPRYHIALDPGIGFGKTMSDNWRLALGAGNLAKRLAPFPLVLGASRKRFLETPAPSDAPLPPHWSELLQRLAPQALHPRDAASGALALLHPGMIHRLHNVKGQVRSTSPGAS